MEDKPVKEMFSAIESRTGVLFLYSDNVIDVEMRISVSAVDEPLETVLDRIFAVTGNSYLISGESVYVLHRARGGTLKDWSTPERAEELRDSLPASLSEAVRMDDILVVAYGRQKRSSFTGSASVVSSETIMRRPVTSVLSAIEGFASGVQVEIPSGAPEAVPAFRIRGVSSINAGNAPLIVVDGAPYSGGSGINDINPGDVERVTILKDAASTAIYGARGGNGVILITTKKASTRQRISVVFNAGFAVSQPRADDMYDVLDNPGEFYEQHYRALHNYYMEQYGYDTYRANRAVNALWTKNSDEGGLGYLIYTVPRGEQLVGFNGRLNPAATLGRVVEGRRGGEYLLYPDDLMKETFKTGFRQDYNLSIKGGSDRIALLGSLGYTDVDGITGTTGYERWSGRLNGSFEARRWLRVSANVDFAKSTTDIDPYLNENSNNIFTNIFQIAPIYPVYVRDVNGDILRDDNGRVYDYGDGTYNAGNDRPIRPGSNRLQEIRLQTNRVKSVKVGVQGAVEATIVSGLTATANATWTNRDSRHTETRQPFYGSSYPGGRVSLNSARSESLDLQQLLDFKKSFGGHNVGVTLLHEYYESGEYILAGSRSKMFDYFGNLELSGAIEVENADSWSTGYRSEGFGGRVLYDYRDIYHFSASYRRDASSNFAPAHRWGDFFSFGGAWIVSNEKFFGAGWVDHLKLKLSYGRNGNDNIGSHRYTDTYDITNLNDEVALSFRGKGNEEITWETRSAVNAGVEFSAFRGRLSAEMEYYSNTTTDMLASVSVPTSLGYDNYWANVGSMRNSGFEFDVGGDIVSGKDFRFSLSVKGLVNKARILVLAKERTGQQLYDTAGRLAGNGYNDSGAPYFYGEGMEYRRWRLKKFAGTDDTGRPLWYVLNGQTGELTTTAEYSYGSYFDCGSSQPKITGGFSGSVAWRAFELSIGFSYRLGGMALDRGYASLMTPPYSGHTGYNFHRDIYDSWTPENRSDTNARWQYGDRNFTSTSDRWLTEADWLNLQNVTISYTIPQKRVEKARLEKVVVSAGVDDPFFWSKRRGFIPARSFDGDLNMGNYPGMRRFMLNVRIDF